MSGPGLAAGPGGCPRRGPGSALPRFHHSETRRLELESKLEEYAKSDAYLMKLKYVKLKKYLREVDERQKGALLRNRALLEELDRFEAHLKTSSSAMIQRMEAWYGREIKSALSRHEGDLSARVDMGEEQGEQMPWAGRQAGIGTKTTVLRGLYHPATVFMGHHTSAVVATGGLGMRQDPPQPTESCSVPDSPSCSPSLEGLGPESRSADLQTYASVEGAARCGDLPASEEGSEQLISSTSDPKAATSEEEQPRGSISGPKPHLGNWGMCKKASQESSTGLLIPRSAEEVMLSTPDMPQGVGLPAAGWEQGRYACAEEDSPSQPPNPVTGQEELSVTSAPDGPALSQDVDALQTCLSHHTSFLGKHQAQLSAEAAAMFERLLVPSEEVQDGQALPGLREALPEERGDGSSAPSNESSCSLPAIPNDDSRELQQANHAPLLAGAAEQEVTGRGKDESEEESAVEKIPITGWDGGNDGSKGKVVQEAPSDTSSSSKERSPPLPRTETRRGMATAIRSRAFWGESDDSSSELEAALRPRAHSAEADEFDDFYE